MEILVVTLNIEFYQFIIALILAIFMVIGSPYAVRRMNKNELEKKADCTELEKVKAEVKLKVDESAYEKFSNCINMDIKEKADKTVTEDKFRAIHHRLSDTDKAIESKFSQLVEANNETQKDVKRILTLMIEQKTN